MISLLPARHKLIRLGLIGAIAALLLTMFVNTGEATAQQTGLGVAPAIFEAALEPGKPQYQSVTVANTGGSPVRVRAGVRALLPADGARLAAGRSAAVYDVSSWITFESPEITLQPREEKAVRLTILPPADAAPGGHYATVVFTAAQDTYPGQNTASLASEVGSLAFLTVKGDIRESGLLRWPAGTPLRRQFGPVEAVLEYENTGNVHSRPIGEIRVTDHRGREVLREQPAPRMILPGTVQTYPVRWGDRWQFGRYTVNSSYTYGSPQQTAALPPLTVWVVPTVPLYFISVLLLMLSALTIRYRQRLRLAARILRGKENGASA